MGLLLITKFEIAMKIFCLSLILLTIYLQGFTQVQVKGYYRKNGTYVSPHTRSSPNRTTYDNYSHQGNINPYTGAVGYKTDEYSNGKRTYRKVYSKKVKINKNSYFYTSYGSTSKINSITSNKEIEIVGEADNNFYLIKYGEKEGFMDKKFIAESDRSVSLYDYSDSTMAVYTPLVNIDTLRGKVARIVVQKAILREFSETNDSNIIKTLPFGTQINVLYADINDFWVVKHEDSIGVMLNTFFSYDIKVKKKRFQFLKFFKFK